MLNCLKSPVQTIFIMLGQKCNFNCRYCMQHGEEGLHIDLPQEINPDIYEYIETVAKARDEKDQRLGLHFYGGEPLIYFDNIKKIVEKTKDLDVQYSFISNGYAITQEMVDFFNEYNFFEAISWDGKQTKNTRRIDVFSIPEKKELLLQLNKLDVSAVLSAFTSPKQLLNDFQELSDEYYKIHNYMIAFNIDELFDTGISDRALFNIDYDKISDEMLQLCKEYIEHQKNGDILKIPDFYIKQLMDSVQMYCKYRPDDNIASCRNGYGVINMDLSGVFYNCHNSTDQLGNIYDSPYHILNKMLSYDHIREYKKECNQCPVQSLCRNGCKLMSKKVREESYCKLKRAVFLPVIQYILTYAKADI